MFSATKAFSVCFATAKQTVYIASQSITKCTWKGKPAYKTGSPEQQACIDTTFKAAKVLRFDDHGAEVGEIPGPYHNHGSGMMWITVQFIDGHGNTIWHKKKDGSEWNRIHLYRDLAKNLEAEEIPIEIYIKPVKPGTDTKQPVKPETDSKSAVKPETGLKQPVKTEIDDKKPAKDDSDVTKKK